RVRRAPIASSPPSAKAESLPLADFYSGQQPDNLAASVVDYCSGVLTFEAGNWFRWLNLYATINLSPMSIGTWLLTFFIMLSVVYAYTFVRGAPGISTELRYRLRVVLSWMIIPFGIGVAVYTGVLLGAMPSRPFWNSPILAMLFMLSSISTGIAAILLARALFSGKQDSDEEAKVYHRSGYLFASSDVLLIGLELLVIFLFLMFAHLTVGDVKQAVSVVLPGGILAPMFFLWVVLIGLVAPAIIELYYVLPKLLYHQAFAMPRSVEVVVPAAILVGGFMLRYVVVVAGQITGPVGI
ncbi:MAG: polysulfide reductase NrfD, partial [Rhodospirillaceae bacterium]|nr:polysulfide reductase NrfD [Rhodospirillaceae bacterium]MBT6610274.1 polysulfide reductase NrfD [Rhodospirillaceae bacterium]